MDTFKDFTVPEKNFVVKEGQRLSLSPKQVALRGQHLHVLQPAMEPGGRVHVLVRRDITFAQGELIGLQEEVPVEPALPPVTLEQVRPRKDSKRK